MEDCVNNTHWQCRKNLPALPADIRIYNSKYYKKKIIENPNIKAVIIPIQSSNNYYQLTKKALLAGKDVFVERLFIETIREPKELIDIACAKKKILSVGYEYMYDPNIHILKKILEDKLAGYVIELELNKLVSPPQGKFDKRLNVIEILAPDMLSILQTLFGTREVRELNSIIRGGEAQIGFSYGGTNIRMNISFNNTKDNTTIIVKGTNLTITLDYFKGSFEVKDNNGNSLKKGDKSFPKQLFQDSNKHPTALKLEFNAFFEAIETRRSPSNSLAHTLWICELVSQSKKLASNSNRILPASTYHSYISKMLPDDKVKKFIKGEYSGYPKEVEFHVGITCLANCIFCFRNIHGKKSGYEYEIQNKIPTLKPEDYKNILEDLANNGTQFIYVLGGLEPLRDLNSLAAIINTASEKGLKIIMYTNGIPKTWDAAIPLMLKTSKTRVSLHAATPETYNKIFCINSAVRQPKEIFNRVLNHLQRLIKEKKKTGSKTNVGISVLLTPLNYQEILKVAELACGLGLDFLDIRIDYINIVKDFSIKEKSMLLSLLAELYKRTKEGEYGGISVNLPDCFVPFGGSIVEAPFYSYPSERYFNRGVYPFVLTIDPFGKVFGTSIAAQPGVRILPWAQEQFLGQIKNQPGELGELLRKHIQRGTKFHFKTHRMEASTRHLLFILKKIEKDMNSNG